MNPSSIPTQGPDAASLADPVRRVLSLGGDGARWLPRNRKQKARSQTGPGSGPPTKLYRPAFDEVHLSFPAREYELAGRLLASAIETSVQTGEPVAEALRAVAHAEGQRLGMLAGSVGKALADNGFEPEADAQGLILSNGPFHRVRRNTQLVCGLNTALLQGTLDGCNDKRHRVESAPEGSACCARLTTPTEWTIPRRKHGAVTGLAVDIP